MIIRKIRPAELKRVKELSSIAFEYPMDNEKSPQEFYEEAALRPKSREDESWESHFAAFQDDDATMMSALAVIPYFVRFDGRAAGMAGIGGVSTFPQYRRMGGIRGCFDMALPWMRESGAVFSYLYPFSTAYYRRFGYEMGCRRRQYKLRMDFLPRFQAEGSCFLLEQGADLKKDIIAVSRVWEERYNMMVIGDSHEFAWVDQANPPKDQEFTYVYKSRDGVPMGYVTYRRGEAEGRRVMRLRRLMFTCPEGFKGLMRLLSGLAADYCAVHFHLPEDMDIAPLMPEWSMGAGSCELLPWGMVRVVNVEKALEMAQIPGEGRFSLSIQDGQLPENCGCFQVKYGNGENNLVARTTEKPDVEMDIGSFSSLILGVYETDAISYMDRVRARVPLPRLAPLFHKKKCCITENF